MSLSQSLLEDTRNFSTKNLLEAKAFYERKVKEEPDEVESARHLATLQVLRERGEVVDTLCEICLAEVPYTHTTDQVYYCPNCKTYTCTHLSLETEDGERCNECETELEGQYWLADHPLLHEE